MALSLRFIRGAALQLRALTLRTMSTEIVRDPIVSTRHPNTFGTLGVETARTQIAKLPEEDGDITRTEFMDDKEHTRLPLRKYGRIIQKLLVENRLKEAIDVLEVKMKNENVFPDRYTYNLLISGCAAKGYTQKAFQLFNQMKKRGIRFSGSTYTSLMNACANSPFPDDGIKRVNHLRQLMKEKGHQPDERTYHATIKAYGRCGDLESAFNIVDEMLDRQVLISAVTYNFLLQACVSDKESGFRHALMVWRKMMERKVKPDIYTFNLLLRCARDCSVGDLEMLREDVRNMTPPNQRTYLPRPTSDSTALQMAAAESEGSACPAHSLVPSLPAVPNLLVPTPQLENVVTLGKVKQPWDRLALMGGANGFLAVMSASRTTPDIKTFSLLVDTMEPSTESEEELIKTMKAMQIKLNLEFCNWLIKKRAMTGRFGDAKKCMVLIKERSLKPDLITFGVLALTCTKFEDARDLVDSMGIHGYRVNIEMVGGLFLRAAEKFDLKMMRFVIAKLKQERITTNKKFWAHVDKFHSRMKRHFDKLERGEHRHYRFDDPDLKEDYRQICESLEKLKTFESEDDTLHPWEQFKRPKSVEAVVV